jgi:anaerobic magnesium-protoporphyrin IX monomethyl ester cyclase
VSNCGTKDIGARLRILLVYPPSRTQFHATCPIGLLMLGAVLEEAGHEVHVLDANAVRMRLSSEEVAALASTLKPNVIGMTILTTLAREAYRLARLLRPTGARLLAGGPHATLVPEEPLEHGFDAVATGEGEPMVDAAVRALTGAIPMGDVPGWVYRSGDGEMYRTAPCPAPPDLDALPFPARHLANPAHYQPLNSELPIFSSRGCTARCTYCAGGLFGKKFRFRSAENVLREIRQLHASYGTKHFHFCDDSMSMDRKRALAICRGIRDAALPITWSMMTRIDGVNEELLTEAARSGCVQIDYGVESGSPSTLRKIRKPHTVDMVRRTVPLTARLGITPCVFFIVGFPWEKVEDIEATRALMQELAPCVGDFHPALGSVLVPFPGTAIYETYKDEFGFQNWWLGEERNFDVPRIGTHSYCDYVVFRCGAILDADFFRYSPEVTRKIRDVFQFMYFQNLQRRGRLSRTTQKTAFTLSAVLSRRWPRLERRVFGVVAGLAEGMRRRQQERDLAKVGTSS